MKQHKTKAFTLVELIIVITILAILATIGFMSYSSYTSDARDANRITSLNLLRNGLDIYKIKNRYFPMPDGEIILTASGTILSYQGYIGTGVLFKINTNDIKDPLYNSYYTYLINSNKSDFQLLSFLDNNNGNNVSYNNLLDNVYANNYSDKYIYTVGDKLGIILDSLSNSPIQEFKNTTFTGIDIVNTENSYKAIIDNSLTGVIIGTGNELKTISVKLDNDKSFALSCYDIKSKNLDFRGNGLYWLNPNLDSPIQVFCDMDTNGGGRTLVHKTTDNQNDLSGDLTITEGTPNWSDDNEYRLGITYWKNLSTRAAMAINIRVDGLSWNDIENGYINTISTGGVSFSSTDNYRLFNYGTIGGIQNTCTSGTKYWNNACCTRCVNYDVAASYGSPINSPMLSIAVTSYTGSAIEGASGSVDANRHRLSKMGIFLK